MRTSKRHEWFVIGRASSPSWIRAAPSKPLLPGRASDGCRARAAAKVLCAEAASRALGDAPVPDRASVHSANRRKTVTTDNHKTRR